MNSVFPNIPCISFPSLFTANPSIIKKCKLCPNSFVTNKPTKLSADKHRTACGDHCPLPDIFAIDISDTFQGYDIDPKLNEAEKRSVIELIKLNYLNKDNIIRVPCDYEMKIRLTNDVPISFPLRRLSYADKIEVNKMIQDLLYQGCIRPSHSPYAFPIVVVPKKNGERRMCVDFRPLNKITIRDNYPLPLIDDCLERLENKRFFSLLDLKSGFHQVKMAEDSIQCTSFVTPGGQYEYVRMPFGLQNAPAVFQRFINHILRSFIDEGSVIVYMDDIAIASVTISEHLELLGRVLRRLAEYDLELKLSKCQLYYERIDFLGFSIGREGIRPNNRHIESIQRMVTPKNTHDIQKCLGLFSYFRRFIPSFSTISMPMS